MKQVTFVGEQVSLGAPGPQAASGCHLIDDLSARPRRVCVLVCILECVSQTSKQVICDLAEASMGIRVKWILGLDCKEVRGPERKMPCRRLRRRGTFPHLHDGHS